MYSVVEKRAKLDCIGLDLLDEGELATRLAKATFNPDGSVERRGQPHRFVLTPSYNLEASLEQIDVMIAHVTPHLAAMGFSPPNQRDIEILKGIGRVIWTPEVIARRRAKWTELGHPEFLIPQYEQIQFNVRLDESVRQWMEHEALTERGIEIKTEEARRKLGQLPMDQMKELKYVN